ncbi:MAG: hypothetical protein K2X86_02420, partial [Cytophagaceae bacterium]|nr:hypothetical protein [Cytophagaceae bacterium]
MHLFWHKLRFAKLAPERAINHPIAANDPGQDAVGGAYTKDVFGMALHYYNGDYKRTGKNLHATASITPQSGSHIKDKGKDLYNGNISAWTTYTGFDQTSSTVDPLMGQGFRYDKLNRLVNTFAETKVAYCTPLSLDHYYYYRSCFLFASFSFK